MAEEYKVSNLQTELHEFLHAQARRTNYSSEPLVLRTQFKNTPYVSDTSKKLFSIDMTNLVSFRDYFNDKSYKYIRLQNWEFNLKFKNKRCTSIELNSQHIALIASKNVKKQIKDCLFSFEFADESAIQQLDKKSKGFLNRLGKRNLVANSEYVAEQHYNLISFVKKPLNFSAVEKICLPSAKESEENPLNYLNQRGKELLEKLRHFITKQDLLNFMVEQELSQDGERHMRRLILSQAIGSTKKKVSYSREVVDSLHKISRE